MFMCVCALKSTRSHRFDCSNKVLHVLHHQDFDASEHILIEAWRQKCDVQRILDGIDHSLVGARYRSDWKT
jgi:hypothetical protein